MKAFPHRIKTVLDTNVLYSRILRDFFLYADSFNLIKAHWSERTLMELSEALQTNLPAFDDDAKGRLLLALHQYYPDALVTEDRTVEREIIELGLPDIDDAHVIAAALSSESSLICTSNLSDFPAEVLDRYSVTAMSPDALLLHLLIDHPMEFAQVVEQIKVVNPSFTSESIAISLKRAGAVQTARALAKTL